MNSIDLTNTGFLDSLLLLFETKSVDGIGYLLPHALWLLVILGVLQLTTTWTLYEGDTRVRELLNLVFKVGVAAFLVYNFGKIAMLIFQSFQHAGFVAAGPTAEGLSTPSSIVDRGMNVCARIWYYITNNVPLGVDGNQYFDAAGNFKPDSELSARGWKETLAAIPQMFLVLLCGLVMLLSFFWIAFQIMLTQIEFYLFLIIGMFLIPFMVLRHTAFLSQKVWSGLVQYSVKIMALAFIVGLIGNVLNDIMIIKDADIKTLLTGVLGVGTMALLTAMVPQVIAGMVSGGAGAGMQASQFKQMAAGAVGAAVGGAGATLAMSRLAQTRMRMQQLAKGAGAKGGGKEGGDSNSSGGKEAGVANTGTEATQTGSPESAATRQRMQADARGVSSGAVASAPATGGDMQTDPVGDSVEATPSDAHSDARSDQADKAAAPADNKMRKLRNAATYTGRFASAFAVIAAQHAIANSRFGRSAIQTVKNSQDFENFTYAWRGEVPERPIVPDGDK
ncbi:type IV secretion system protein [Negativicoccus succinicivorans]|uniref:type IV secretion system protein n=1 Tax=Negativicoccus succinicivorans TaxID=620903 RepID=UPI0029111A69|nr:type IV secretion system protein [Negativicoccus succinicivorans]MDU5530077.1 type IV secretion system protein [Negativicoccus succinicivorans]